MKKRKRLPILEHSSMKKVVGSPIPGKLYILDLSDHARSKNNLSKVAVMSTSLEFGKIFRKILSWIPPGVIILYLGTEETHKLLYKIGYQDYFGLVRQDIVEFYELQEES